MNVNTQSFFNLAVIHYFDTADATLAVRIYGSGPPLVFIHGFPTYGYTWRHLLPELSKKYTCYVLDMPGLGMSQWTEKTDFHFSTQAKRVVEFIKAENLEDCTIIAHDTGATTARFAALDQSIKVDKLIIINTEVPNHRPPWIPLYQFTSKLPLAHLVFRAFLKTDLFVRSPMGFRAFYADKSLLKKPENLKPYLDLLTESNRNVIAAFNYLRGCDLKYMDTLKEKHALIDAKVLLIWGTKDVTFPVKYGESMVSQFKNAHFFKLDDAALMPHEEQPEKVLEIILNH